MNDAVGRTLKLEFVKAQLGMYAGEKKAVQGSTFLLCPFHSEKTPSGRVFHSEQSLSPGFFKCYGCGHTGTWDEVAERLGLQPFRKGPPKEERASPLQILRKQHESLRANNRGYREDKFKFWDIPKNKTWRTIPTNLLIELGGRMCYKWSDEYKRWGSTKFIYMPVLINGVQRGFFRARLKKDESDAKLPSYYLAAAEGSNWSKTHGLWPYDHAIEMMRELKSNTIVIVEGQRDALRLLVLGIPAMCIFGTQSWSSNKCKLLELAGVERVVMLMDGDPAGIDATEKIAPSLRSMFNTKVIKLWKIKGSPYLKVADAGDPAAEIKRRKLSMWDPGNCPEWILTKIKRKFFRG